MTPFPTIHIVTDLPLESASDVNPAQSTTATLGPDSEPTPVQFRIEEKTRTIYVSSNMPLSQWDDASREQLLKLSSSDSSGQPMKRHSVSDLFSKSPQDRPGNGPHTRQMRSSRSFSPATQSPSRKRARPKILFYAKNHPFFGFTNFSPHPVVYKGKVYPTSEHLFQAFKFLDHRPLLAEHIRTYSDRPSVAFSEARRFQPEVRKDWKAVNVSKMDEVLRLKFEQHAEMRAELLSTGDAELIEDSDKDAFWGVGPDGNGRNELGKALERLRASLRGSS